MRTPGSMRTAPASPKERSAIVAAESVAVSKVCSSLTAANALALRSRALVRRHFTMLLRPVRVPGRSCVPRPAASSHDLGRQVGFIGDGLPAHLLVLDVLPDELVRVQLRR